MADTLFTMTPNNGSGGVFTQITGISSVTINSFDVAYTGTAFSAATVEVWTRSGAYAGFTGSNAGWTLSESVAGVRGATNTTLTNLDLANDSTIAAGSTTAIYLHCITSGGGIRYGGTGASPPNTTWSDANLSMFSAHARTGAVPFGGSEFTPRTFAGNVNYTVNAVPEPATMALAGLAAATVAARRRRK